MFVDGYSIKRASALRRVVVFLGDIVRSWKAGRPGQWKRNVTIKKLSEM